MSEGFFDRPFDEETNIKLRMFEDYLNSWIPVFLGARRPFVNVINIFDFFAGAGCDSENVPGSPLLAIKALMYYEDFLPRADMEINIYLNDHNPEYCERLNNNLEEINYDRMNINVKVLNLDFLDALSGLRPNMKDAANFIFLDQFGIKHVDKKCFTELIHLKTTDILFFVSSSFYNRFSSDPNISRIVGISEEEVKKTAFNEIHRLMIKTYRSFIPPDHNYAIAPYSIKKGSNIYGLIFGSGHPLGMEKFLEVCWNKDTLTGEANFDIDRDHINLEAPSLFPEMDIPKKIDVFTEKLEQAILSGNLKTDREVYLYGINRGFIARHIRPVISALKSQGKITISNPSFKCSTVWKRGRAPKIISLL